MTSSWHAWFSFACIYTWRDIEVLASQTTIYNVIQGISNSMAVVAQATKEPGHQQPCYWPYYSRISLFLYQMGFFNTLRPRQNGCHFPDDIFKWIFLNENVWMSIRISLKFVPINNIPALVRIMDWRRPGDKPLSESMMASLLTQICVTRLQSFKSLLFIMGYIVNGNGEIINTQGKSDGILQ